MGLLELLKNNGDNLKELDLQGTQITRAGLTGFHAPQLEKLNLSECENITDMGLLELLANNGGNLKELDLRLTKITGAGLTGFHAPQLEMLDLRWCENITDNGQILKRITGRSDE